LNASVDPRQAALDFLYGRINYESTSAIPYHRSGLRWERMRALLTELDDPQRGLRIVHIAGTKGKGSVAAMVSAALVRAGYRTGLFTSPHLERLEERLVVNERPCSGDELVSLVERVRPAVATLDARGPAWRPTFFEIVTGLGLLYFAIQRVQTAVVEVGLGGRLDSTNIVDPDVTVITSISFDHVKQLGNTLAAIAQEKAGIIKPGVPVVSGVELPEPRDVIRRIAQQQRAALCELGEDFRVDYRPPVDLERGSDLASCDLHVKSGDHWTTHADLRLGLLGKHQAHNAAVAWVTLQTLQTRGWDLPEAAIRAGFREVPWPARVEVMMRRPTVILDTAHNEASIQALLETLEVSFRPKQKILVFAATQDKDVDSLLKHVLPRFDRVVLTRYLNNPRGVPLADLQAAASAARPGPWECRPDPLSAWAHARSLAGPEDLICITGSTFLAAELRGPLLAEAQGQAHVDSALVRETPR